MLVAPTVTLDTSVGVETTANGPVSVIAPTDEEMAAHHAYLVDLNRRLQGRLHMAGAGRRTRHRP